MMYFNKRVRRGGGGGQQMKIRKMKYSYLKVEIFLISKSFRLF